MFTRDWQPWLCVLEKDQRGDNASAGLAWPLSCFQSLHPLPICNWHHSSCCPGCGSQSGWVCMYTGSFFHHPKPHWVYSQKLCSFIFSGSGALGCTIWPMDGLTSPQGVPLIFIHQTWLWGCLIQQLLLLQQVHSSPTPYVHIALNPWLLDFCTVLDIFLGDFLAVLGVFHF